MGKVFTITEGVENLGALKSGGQGSVYKARKRSEIITAIKILPTPIAIESEEDKHFVSFNNEVEKLRKVNEVPNPNVVSIITSGLTSSGNLPYIEMEFIDGPDLAELLKSPFDPVFTIKETIKVADHLANALAHCHRSNIKHGDIKSNNVKYNQRTGNYMLLDFGLSVMSDEQRRTSIRYAGAIEFMAPEQSSGETLFETDVYSFGIILFELLAGTVPFPLINKGEMARNAVMLAHMETLPPDIITLRRDALPGSWNEEKKEREMHIPLWLLQMIYKCLEKDPAKRFKDGTDLQNYIHSEVLTDEQKKHIHVPAVSKKVIHIDDAVWRKEITKLKDQLNEKEQLLGELQLQVDERERELYQVKYNASKRRGVSKSLVVILLIIALGLGGFAAYNTLRVTPPAIKTAEAISPDKNITPITDTASFAANNSLKKLNGKVKKNYVIPASSSSYKTKKKLPAVTDSSAKHASAKGSEYEILTRAYLYNSPNKNDKSDFYLTPGDATLSLTEETNEFAYVVVLDVKGKPIKGWLRKKDFVRSNDY